ncbi:MAG: hypothetical protein WD048_03055 [Chitinophagales bacterium]
MAFDFRNFRLATIVLFALLLFSSCDKDNNDPDDNDIKEDKYTLDHFYSGISTLKLEVAYETGAEPIIESGGILGNEPAWNLTKNNIEALFQGRSVETQIDLPLTLQEMTEIPKQKQGDYSSADIKEIADEFRKGVNEGSTGNIFILFVDAYYSSGGERQENVLGVALGETPYVAIFKPVINSVSSGSRKNVEQATVIHEVGHAIGLVNFGLPMTANHQDEDHGKHCTNEDCVMYWTVENKSDITDFIGIINDNEKILFGQECLDDARAYQPEL